MVPYRTTRDTEPDSRPLLTSGVDGHNGDTLMIHNHRRGLVTRGELVFHLDSAVVTHNRTDRNRNTIRWANMLRYPRLTRDLQGPDQCHTKPTSESEAYCLPSYRVFCSLRYRSFRAQMQYKNGRTQPSCERHRNGGSTPARMGGGGGYCELARQKATRESASPRSPGPPRGRPRAWSGGRGSSRSGPRWWLRACGPG